MGRADLNIWIWSPETRPIGSSRFCFVGLSGAPPRRERVAGRHRGKAKGQIHSGYPPPRSSPVQALSRSRRVLQWRCRRTLAPPHSHVRYAPALPPSPPRSPRLACPKPTPLAFSSACPSRSSDSSPSTSDRYLIARKSYPSVPKSIPPPRFFFFFFFYP